MSKIVDILKRLPRRRSGVQAVPYRRRGYSWWERHFFAVSCGASLSLGAFGVWHFGPRWARSMEESAALARSEKKMTARDREIAALKAEAEKIKLEPVALALRVPQAEAQLNQKAMTRMPASVNEVTADKTISLREEKHGATFLKKHALALDLYRKGKFAQAFDEFKKLNEVKPQDVAVLINLAMTAKQLKNLKEAEAYALLALGFDPKNAHAHNNYGMLCLERGDLDQAETHFSKAVALLPTYADALVNRGRALELMNEYQPAVESYQAYVELKDAPSSTKKLIRERMRRLLALARIQSAPQKEDL